MKPGCENCSLPRDIITPGFTTRKSICTCQTFVPGGENQQVSDLVTIKVGYFIAGDVRNHDEFQIKLIKFI